MGILLNGFHHIRLGEWILLELIHALHRLPMELFLFNSAGMQTNKGDLGFGFLFKPNDVVWP